MTSFEKHIKRFWAKVDKRNPNECWEWHASTNSYGYGCFGWFGKIRGSHRISWMLHNGPIPEGMFVCHKCDNPLCVNPNHLFLGTQKDNMEDRERKGRGADHSGENQGRSKLKESEVREIIKLYSTGKYIQKELGLLFGVSQVQISNIVTGESWSKVK